MGTFFRSHSDSELAFRRLTFPEKVIPVTLAWYDSANSECCRQDLLKVITSLLAWIVGFIAVIIETEENSADIRMIVKKLKDTLVITAPTCGKETVVHSLREQACEGHNFYCCFKDVQI